MKILGFSSIFLHKSLQRWLIQPGINQNIRNISSANLYHWLCPVSDFKWAYLVKISLFTNIHIAMKKNMLLSKESDLWSDHGGAHPGEHGQALPGQLQQDGRQGRDPANQAPWKSAEARELNLFYYNKIFFVFILERSERIQLKKSCKIS